MYDVVVVGSIVVDLISYVNDFPNTGQTVFGHKFTKGFGGKGANQCVMAKLLGANTAMIGKVGDDVFGRDYIERLKSLSIDTANVRVSGSSLSTGAATIAVRTSDGANQIVITPGANYDLSAVDVELCAELIAGSKVVLCQLEIPLESTYRALNIAKEHNVLTIFNPAPISTDILHLSAMPAVDIFCPNETEASIITNIPVTDVKSAMEAIRFLFANCGEKIKWPMITLGQLGVVFGDVTNEVIVHEPAPIVDAIDSTGAGDCFAGSLAYFCALHPGMSMAEKVKQSIRLASLSVQRYGTQSSFPDRTMIGSLL